MAYTQTNRPMRLYTPLGDDVLLLEGITGTERISRPFEYTLDMLSKNVTDIVEQVFTDHHFTDFSLDLVKTYAKRDYCVQYRETGFDFVNRLLEEEGIYYYFEHSTSAHKLILSDAPSKYKYCPDQKSARFAIGASSRTEDDVVIDLQ